MATKLPLKKFTGTVEIRFEVKAGSFKSADRRVLDAIRSIYKTVRITKKTVDYIEADDRSYHIF